jgi:hypothetical protein
VGMFLSEGKDELSFGHIGRMKLTPTEALFLLGLVPSKQKRFLVHYSFSYRRIPSGV